MARPTIRVYLDDGTGTYPWDISGSVRLTAGITATSGRDDEFDTPDPLLVKLRLDNYDGRFSLGSAQYGCHTGQKIKITRKAGAYALRTWWLSVTAWPTEWADDIGLTAFAQLDLVDMQAKLTRERARSTIDVAVRAWRQDGTTAVYVPMTEAEGSTSVGDSLGSIRPLQLVGAGAAPIMAAAEGPAWAEGSVPTFAAGQFFRGGMQLRQTPDPITGSQIALSAFVNTTADQISAHSFVRTVINGDPFISLALGRGADVGKLLVRIDWAADDLFGRGMPPTLFTLNRPLNTGEWHHVAVVIRVRPGAAGGHELAVNTFHNGDFADTRDHQWTPGAPLPRANRLDIGRRFNGSVGHVVLNTYSPETIAFGGLKGFDGDPVYRRANRIASAFGLGMLSNAVTELSGQKMDGSPWDLLQQIAESEGSTVEPYTDKLLRLPRRDEAWLKATGTPAVTTTAATVDSDISITGDTQFVTNRATATRTDGAQIAAENTDSIKLLGETFETDLGTLMLRTDDEVRARCEYRVHMAGDVHPRVNQLTFELIDKPPALQAAVAQLERGDRIVITNLPDQAPETTLDLIVEGAEDTHTRDAWTRVLNCSPARYAQPWILEDATFGVLEKTTRPAF